MAFVAPSRLQAIIRLRCQIFQTSYNPTGVRTGAKYLRARLRGPSMVQYYPPEISVMKIARQYPELQLVDEEESQRFRDIEDKKRRGKGAPKKAKTKGTLVFLTLRRPRQLNLPPLSQRTVGERARSGRCRAEIGPFLYGFWSSPA